MARRGGRRFSGVLEWMFASEWLVSAVMLLISIFIGFWLHAWLVRGASLAPLMPAIALPLICFGLAALVRYCLARRAATKRRMADDLAQAEASRFVQSALALVSCPAAGQISSVAFAHGASGANATYLDLRADKPTAWSLELIQRIEWKRFGDLCAQFYREKGIRCETTSLGAAGGVDIRLFQGEVKSDGHNSEFTSGVGGDGRTTAIVQCKAWGERPVDAGAVRELLAVMTQNKIPKAFFMTNGSFTAEARRDALANPLATRITLLDGKLFLAMIDRLPKAAQQRLLTFATVGDYTTPSCVHCGVKMIAREGATGKFWGCVAFPRCRQSLPMSQAHRLASQDVEMQGMHPCASFSPPSQLQLDNGLGGAPQEPGDFLLQTVTKSRRLPTRPPLS